MGIDSIDWATLVVALMVATPVVVVVVVAIVGLIAAWRQ